MTRADSGHSQLELLPVPVAPADDWDPETKIPLLYRRPLPSGRQGALFNAHSYPTKINVSAAAACILAHTKPGDLVFDGFSGSGVTGLAAAMCNEPTPELRKEVTDQLGPVRWGARRAVLYDLSPLATFISTNLLTPPPVEDFGRAARTLLDSVQARWGWLYGASDNNGAAGKIRHTIWSEVLTCGNCRQQSTYWDTAVVVSPPAMLASPACPSCGVTLRASTADRVLERYWDELTSTHRTRRKRQPVYVYGRTGNVLWKRPSVPADIDLLQRIGETPVPASVPVVPMKQGAETRWGEMFRSGYHTGISHVHHFYTRRNLIALGALVEAINNEPPPLRKALMFWLSSYNSSHSTLMTRIVCKKSAKDFVVTGCQPGALYISSLPVEKNVFLGLRLKLASVLEAFAAMRTRQSQVSVRCGSCLHVDLPDNSVDYAFTDPPFGQNIQYAEVNRIAEAWLGLLTDDAEEVVIAPMKGKTLSAYQELLTNAFHEIRRVLKPGSYATVVFHSTQQNVWEALRAAWEGAGLAFVGSSALNKTQASFKQTTTFGAVRNDPLILLQKPLAKQEIEADGSRSLDLWPVIDAYLLGLTEEARALADRHHLYSLFVRLHLERGVPVSMGAAQFFERLGVRTGNGGDSSFTIRSRG